MCLEALGADGRDVEEISISVWIIFMAGPCKRF
jgi:hypothetical protein